MRSRTRLEEGSVWVRFGTKKQMTYTNQNKHDQATYALRTLALFSRSLMMSSRPQG